jgi:RimJ/RimL family protein N-acetyltransferase
VVHHNTYGGRLAPTREAVEAYLARVEGRLDDSEALILAVILREDGSFLGTTLLFGFEPGGRAEIGFWLGSNSRGRGLGKATIELTMRWGFEELGVRRIEGLTAPDNQVSQRAMASAEMVRQPDRDGFVVYASELD